MKLLITIGTKRLIFIPSLDAFIFYVAFMIIITKCWHLRGSCISPRGIRKHEGNPRVCEREFVAVSWLSWIGMPCSTQICFCNKHKHLKLYLNESLKCFFPLASKLKWLMDLAIFFLNSNFTIQPVSSRSAISNKHELAKVACFTFVFPEGTDCFIFVGARAFPAVLRWQHMPGREVHKL